MYSFCISETGMKSLLLEMFYGPDDLFQNGRDGPQPHYLLIICRIVEIELS